MSTVRTIAQTPRGGSQAFPLRSRVTRERVAEARAWNYPIAFRALAWSLSAALLYLLSSTVSNDAGQYEILWHSLRSAPWWESMLAARFEMGFTLFYWTLTQYFSPSITFYLTGLSALTIKHYLIRTHSLYYPLVWAIYVILFMHILEANQVRAAFGGCLVIYALFASKTLRSYLYLGLAATVVHLSALMILFLYFVRRPLIGLSAALFVPLLWNQFITTAVPVMPTMGLFMSYSTGDRTLTNPFFLVQCVIALVGVLRWRTLTTPQKRGAYLVMLGVAFYIGFFNNDLLAHRLRELSMLGVLPMLSLMRQRLTYDLLAFWVALIGSVGFTAWLIGYELVSVHPFFSQF